MRLYADADLGALAGLLGRLVPHEAWSPRTVAHWISSQPERARLRVWVADGDEGLCAVGVARFHWSYADPGVAQIWVLVAPEARGRGLGAELYAAGEEAMLGEGARALESQVFEEAALPFFTRRGYLPTRRERFSELVLARADLSGLPALEEAKAAEGFRVAPLRELLDRSQALYGLFLETDEDVPSDYRRGNVSLEEYLAETLPISDPDGSAVVCEGDRPVALATVMLDRGSGRGEHEHTGTARARRGRGLATLAKLAAIRACREAGIHSLSTSNDEENVPMLAINDRLGYRATATQVRLAKRFGQ